MTRDQALQEVKRQISCTQYLQKSKSGLYCCPYCGSGTSGKRGSDGAVKYYPETNSWYCHSCQKSGDIVDLYMEQNGASYSEALSLLAQEIGVTIDAYRPGAADDFSTAPQIRPLEGPYSAATGEGGHRAPAAKERQEGPTGAPTEADYSDYYAECAARLADPAAIAYLQRRGISPETAAAYMIGYDPAADPAGAGHTCPRLIIPTSKSHYIARRTDGGTEYAKMNPKGSTPAIFNAGALYAQEVQEVFITEGAFDALSILEAGYSAISLNSVANRAKLLEMLEKKRTKATLILCLDNDAAGKKAAAELAQGLQRLNIPHIEADICAGYKDPNEALTGSRQGFIDALEYAQRQTTGRPDNTSYYISAIMAGEIARFKADKKTGFANLDAQAGGLYAGLYALAAISSLGKTSFTLQLADQLAEAGHDVIFFSLEQSRLELVSKSLARRTAQADREKAVTSLAIRKGYLPQQVQEAAQIYREAVGERLSIVEGNFNCDISFVGDYIREYVRRTGERPVVFIDYLQILQPREADRRASTKETVDNTITELKRLSRELNITIIAISSVNRSNYLAPIDFESLKESGSIEFSCDVVWGLQLQCLSDPIFEKEGKIREKREMVKKAKGETPRKIELACLKNRYGKANYSCYFDYYPAQDLFIENTGAEFEIIGGIEWEKVPIM